MLKNISNLGSILDKSEQQTVNGGMLSSSICYRYYFASYDDRCAVPVNGNTVFGTIVNGKCCV